MKPPTRVTVGPTRFTLRFEDGLTEYHGLDGQTRHTRQVIVFDPTQGPDNLKDTVLHELLHTMIAQTPVKMMDGWTVDVEETVVRALTPFLLMVIQDNPKLLEYLRDRS